MRKLHTFLMMACFVSFLSNIQAQTAGIGDYQAGVFEKDNKQLPYRILYPKSYDTTQQYPLLIFLHGSGERGNDNQKQLTHGAKLFADSIQQYPGIIVFPQCPQGEAWSFANQAYVPNSENLLFHTHTGSSTLGLVVSLIQKMVQEESIDTSRVYLAGLSMGGYGAFELLHRFPTAFAAASVICGGAITKAAIYTIETPIWFFHGTKDQVVPPQLSLHMLRGVQRGGGTAKITLFKGVQHNAWDAAFAKPDFLNWIFSKKR